MVQGWPGLSQQAGCDQETGHTDRGAGDAGSEDNYLIISRRGEGRQETGGAGSLPATQPHSCWSCWPGKFARVDLAKLGQERQQYWETTSRQYRDTAGRREGGSSQLTPPTLMQISQIEHQDFMFGLHRSLQSLKIHPSDTSILIEIHLS